MWFAVICNILKTAYFEIIVCVFVRSSTTGALSVAVWCVCVCVCVWAYRTAGRAAFQTAAYVTTPQICVSTFTARVMKNKEEKSSSSEIKQ